MFVLSEENGREEKKNKREQKNVGPVINFSSNLVHSLSSRAIQIEEKT